MKALGKKFPKVLFFTKDMLPSEEEMDAAGAIGPGVVFRNSQYVPENPNPGQIEECEAVAGNVPAAYAAKYPMADSKPVVPAAEIPPAPVDPEIPPAPVVPEAPAAPEVPFAPPVIPEAPQPAANDGWSTTPPPAPVA